MYSGDATHALPTSTCMSCWPSFNRGASCIYSFNSASLLATTSSIKMSSTSIKSAH